MSIEVDSEVNPEVNPEIDSEIDFMAESAIINNPEPHNLLETLSVEITPYCSGTQMWEAIRGLATLTNTTNKINNYVTSGGTARAIEHFNRMPGTTVIQSPTTKTKRVMVRLLLCIHQHQQNKLHLVILMVLSQIK